MTKFNWLNSINFSSFALVKSIHWLNEGEHNVSATPFQLNSLTFISFSLRRPFGFSFSYFPSYRAPTFHLHSFGSLQSVQFLLVQPARARSLSLTVRDSCRSYHCLSQFIQCSIILHFTHHSQFRQGALRSSISLLSVRLTAPSLHSIWFHSASMHLHRFHGCFISVNLLSLQLTSIHQSISLC